ncbi:hypothetical protein TREMEDRAFT_34871, partial [Tremella mesenterica DSM 1558]|uniref:uncharacterized protein n=1 Tax=Tremella mesenterica (strain ATCC 24925 / CBS 8224 / DSM 1558 / NBRC 9311 / NRRL Y-6157 / RJB 2259-6 / UBC 559-6) TaxID=578456 RepID=UPI00032C6B84
SSATRKAQNRVAQREFRLRKQKLIDKIRDLEARVEVLSGDKEERVELMVLLIRNLLKENKDLRDMVKSMASFVGEGLGSCLPRLGLTHPQLDAILNRADTDTAYEAFLALKASREVSEANPGIELGGIRRRAPSAGSKRKRYPSDHPQTDSADRSHTPEDTIPPEPTTGPIASSSTSGHNAPPLNNEFINGLTRSAKTQRTEEVSSEPYAYLFPDLDAFASLDSSNRTPRTGPESTWSDIPNQNSQNAWNLMGYPNRGQLNMLGNWYDGLRPGLFPPTIAGSGIGMGTIGAPAGDFETFGISSSNYEQNGDFSSTQTPQASAGPSVIAGNTSMRKGTTGIPDSNEVTLREAVRKLASDFGTGTADGPVLSHEEMLRRRKAVDEVLTSLQKGNSSNRMVEAMLLISYHIANFRVNHSYHLPPSLQPTVVQRTVAHEHFIDGIIFPSIRDRMILLRGRYDMVEAFYSILSQFVLHGQDPLDHRNWEISEKFLNDFPMLVDDEVYEITNRWRQANGLGPLILPDRPVGHGQPAIPAIR